MSTDENRPAHDPTDDEELDRNVSRRVHHSTEAAPGDEEVYRAASGSPSEIDTDGDGGGGGGGAAERAATSMAAEDDDEPTRSE